MEFKDKIVSLRKEKRISQEELAERLNISRQAIAKWENGESYPDIDNLILLSNIFSISIDGLLKNDNCTEILSAKNCLEYNQIISFLLVAKKNTYAGNRASA